MKFLLLLVLPLMLETHAIAGDSINLPSIDGITNLLTNAQNKALKKYTAYYQAVVQMDLSALHLGSYVLTDQNLDDQTRYTCPKKFSIQLDELTSYVNYHPGFSDNRPVSLNKLWMGLVSPIVINKGKEISLYCECTDNEDPYAMAIGIIGLPFSFLPLEKTRFKWSQNEVEFKVSWRVNVLWGALATRGNVDRALINFGPSKKDLRITYDTWDSTIFNIKKKKDSKHFACEYELVAGSDVITSIHLPSPQSIRGMVQNGHCSQELEHFSTASKHGEYPHVQRFLSCAKKYSNQ